MRLASLQPPFIRIMLFSLLSLWRHHKLQRRRVALLGLQTLTGKATVKQSLLCISLLMFSCLVLLFQVRFNR